MTVNDRPAPTQIGGKAAFAARRSIFGLLNVNKPAGLTSRQVVDRVAKLVRPARAGHAGTLDPLAGGVLVVGVGRATRLVPLVQERPKEYRARFLLGRTSETDDVTGEVAETPGVRPVSRGQIEALLPDFTGRIEQVPPRYSAVHVEGRRAYKLARKGRAVQLSPRTVEVYRIALIDFDWPELDLEIECGAGTYIRSIGRDLGERLGCGAVMSELVRTRIGPFRLEDAVALDELNEQTLQDVLLPATRAVEHLPAYRCSADELASIRHGRRITAELSSAGWPAQSGACPGAENTGASRPPFGWCPSSPGHPVALLTADGELAALAEYIEDRGQLAPRQVFLRVTEGNEEYRNTQ